VYINLYKSMSYWGRAMNDPRNFICANLSPCPKVASNQISMHLGQWFVRVIFFHIPIISPIVASFWA